IVLFLLILALTTAVVVAIVKNRYKQKEKRIDQLRMQTEHQLHALRSQMNPHFIFNSLNAIQFYLNSKGPELSEKYLIDFSKLIRIIFEFSDKKTVNLSEEITFLQLYLEVEKMRFGEKLSYHIHTDPKLNKEHLKIPSLLLQPIVENAVNHGIFHSPNLGFIKIKFIEKGSQSLEITIEDNGVGFAKTQSIYKNSLNKHPSKSTQILKNRIDLLNQTGQFYIEYSVQDLENKITSGTRVTLNISPSKN
ncbi:MAG: histidine kinase, partial [Flavobacteriaceae bacterium]|nr:histidine kinase [Flavobacteriaceae bacterium]